LAEITEGDSIEGGEQKRESDPGKSQEPKFDRNKG